MKSSKKPQGKFCSLMIDTDRIGPGGRGKISPTALFQKMTRTVVDVHTPSLPAQCSPSSPNLSFNLIQVRNQQLCA